MLLLSSADYFKINFFLKKIRNTIGVSNSLDPYPVQHWVCPDLNPDLDCLQRLSESTTKSLLARSDGLVQNY